LARKLCGQHLQNSQKLFLLGGAAIFIAFLCFISCALFSGGPKEEVFHEEILGSWGTMGFMPEWRAEH